MAKFFFLLICVINFYVSAQKDTTNFSYYFNTNSSHFEETKTIDKHFYGKYALKSDKRNDLRISAGDYLIIDSSGIYISKNKLLSISKKEVRENGKYNIKNGYLFGVIEKDSVPTVLQDDRYYFLIPSKAYLFQPKTDKMYSINNHSYLIFSEEAPQLFSVIKLDINNNLVELSELDLTLNQVREINHSLDHTSLIKTYLLDPKPNDWSIILNAFVNYDIYEK
jgi:hypothetical protein